MELTPKTNCANSWTPEDIDRLAQALTFVYKNQKTYSQPLDLADRVSGWRFVLEEKYPVESILSALRRYMTEKTDMPVPADVEAILNPPKAKITQSEFIHAKQQWALEEYKPFSYYGNIVKEYEKQETELRDAPPTYPDKMLSIAKESIKKITD